LSQHKVLSTRPLFEAARKLLNEHFEVEYWTNPERIPRTELLKRVADKDALVCLLTEKVDEELLAAAPKLRIAATVSVGYDNIDVAACTRHKVVATHTPGVLDDTTADFAWTLLMAIARRVLEGDAWMRSGTWPGWDLDQLLGGDVWGKTLGILGFGRIGRGVARRSQGFRMRVIYNDAVRAAVVVSGIGMVKQGALGYWNGKEYAPKEVTSPHELVGLHGSIAVADGLPSIHLHAALTDAHHSLVGGHLLRATIGVVGEVYLETFPGRTFARPLNESLGLRTLDLEPGPEP
jgi:predicted DNA-binding protein with PD1-like motif